MFDAWGWACGVPQCFAPENPVYDLWVVEPDGTGLRNLTRSPGIDSSAAWSPDGTQIAFESNRAGDYDIYVMDADGSNVRMIVGGRGLQASASWSPDGRRIVYDETSRRSKDIMMARIDGSRVRVIRSFYDEQVFDPEWSPNGKWIAFTRGDPDEVPGWGVFVMRTDGTGLRRLTGKNFLGERPSWSPDSRHLVFDGGRCRHQVCDEHIWIVDRRGKNLRRLVDGGGNLVYDPWWSPDGTKVVYINGREDPSDGDLWVVNLDGSADQRLLAKPDTFDWAPAWQPVP